MTLRESLGGDVQRVHEQVDALLDREDGLLVLYDGGRAMSYTHGFGASPCQMELLSVELERTVRNVVGEQPTTKAKDRRNRKNATKQSVVAAVLLCVIGAVIAAGSTAGWLTEVVKVSGLVMLPAAMAAGLVAYFDWRAGLFSRIHHERHEHRKAA